MTRIQCFMLDETDRARRSLRRCTISRWDVEQNRGVYDAPDCPLTGSGYHNAQVRIEDGPLERTEERGTYLGGDDSHPHDDPRWPVACACGYAFQERDYWQLFREAIYTRRDTGDEVTLRDAPTGAMWFAPWMDNIWTPQREHCITVKLPDGTDWTIDSQANNCTIPDDRAQKQHHCWTIEGEPPFLTVGKIGPTCAAGAGSIATPGYHGFLRAGFLEEC